MIFCPEGTVQSRKEKRAIFSFLYFEMLQHIFTNLRWALVPFVSAFIAYTVFGAVLAQSKNTSLTANTWDALWIVLTNKRLLSLSLTPLFCYLASDLLPEPAFGQALLFQLRSRRLWWFGKTITLGLAVIFYIALTTLVLIAIASIIFPWEGEWSQLSLENLSEWGVPPSVFVHLPLTIIGIQLVLLALWWFFLGLLTMIVAHRFQHSAVGFIAGVLINFVQEIDWYGLFPSSITNLFSTEQIFVLTRAIQDSGLGIVTVIYMVSYWILWIAISYVFGLKISLRQDFFQIGEVP